MSFLYRKIKPASDGQSWNIKGLDSIAIENSSGTEVATVSNAGAITGASLTTTGAITGYNTVQVIETVVDASGGGSAQTAAIGTVPADSIILEIVGYVDAAFNGDTTTTAEVGITGNTDKYIDPVDFDASTKDTQLPMTGGTNNDQKIPEYVGTATPIICTWTNTASASAGQVTVRVVYVPLA